MDNLRAIRQISHERLLSARVIDRIVGSDEFGKYYTKCSGPDKLAAEQLVDSSNKNSLESWMIARRKEFDFAALSIQQLRQLGQQLGVRNYNRLPKAPLLLEIENATLRNRQESESIDRDHQAAIAGGGDRRESNNAILAGS